MLSWWNPRSGLIPVASDQRPMHSVTMNLMKQPTTTAQASVRPKLAPAFREAMRNAKGSPPETVISDGLNSYKTLMASLPESQRPKHIANAGVRKRHSNNNRIERLNGTLRERVKVQRGWKSYDSNIAEGQRIHYNFVKPHEALECQTPAQVAGIGIEGENKWLSLLRNAIKTEARTN